MKLNLRLYKKYDRHKTNRYIELINMLMLISILHYDNASASEAPTYTTRSCDEADNPAIKAVIASFKGET